MIYNSCLKKVWVSDTLYFSPSHMILILWSLGSPWVCLALLFPYKSSCPSDWLEGPRDVMFLLNGQSELCCKWQIMVRSQLFTYLISQQEIFQQLLNKTYRMVSVFGETVFNLHISHRQEVTVIHGRPVIWQQLLYHQESHNMPPKLP